MYAEWPIIPVGYCAFLAMQYGGKFGGKFSESPQRYEIGYHKLTFNFQSFHW
jgi:hypothetical protein